MLSDKLACQDIDRTIHEEILRMLRQQGRDCLAVSNADTLQADLGLASADLMQLLTVLSSKLHADPFASSRRLAEVRTIGELCQAYRQSLAVGSDAAGDSDLLLASRRRAQARRDRRRGE